MKIMKKIVEKSQQVIATIKIGEESCLYFLSFICLKKKNVIFFHPTW